MLVESRLPVKKGLEPIKWLRTINALKNISRTQKDRNIPNSTPICMSTLFFQHMCASALQVGKRSLCYILTVNRTVSFDPEFLCAIEISHIELALPLNIQRRNFIIFNACEISSNFCNANIALDVPTG